MRSAKLIVSFALVGIVALGLWQWRDGASDSPGQTVRVSSDQSTLVRPSDNADDAADIDSATRPEMPAPGTMEAALLNTTEANRVQMLTLAISDAGYACPPGASAKAAGGNGAIWRVHCGESNVYWVEVNEFGRLLVAPLPYGDFLNGIGVVPELRFEQPNRTPMPIEPR